MMHEMKNMQEITRVVIPLQQCSSLAWSGDDLVDWVSGGIRIPLDTSIIDSHRRYGYRFDHAIVSPSQDYVALYERLGTKGLLLHKDGNIIREINRSYYQADVYEYPIAFLTLPDGRTGIVHCPHSYEKLEIEEVESGECLTQRETLSLDFFHSRLAVSTDNRYLLDAGWIWHPADMIQLYDVTRVYSEPALFDRFDTRFQDIVRAGGDITNAAFLDNHAILFTTQGVCSKSEEVEESKHALLEPRTIAVYDLKTQRLRSHAPLPEAAGTLMPVGEDFAVGFHEHPKLIDLKTGEVIMRWPDIESGQQDSSIIHHIPEIPPIALDAQNKRFAVASQEAITVIELG